MMASQPVVISGRRGYSAFRMRRLARFRWTAFPTARPAAIPNREVSPGLGKTISTNSGWANDFPNSRTRWKSVDLVRRNLRFTLWYREVLHGSIKHDPTINTLLGYSGRCIDSTLPINLLSVVVHYHSKAIASLSSPALEHLASLCSCHTSAETMYAQAMTDFRLISTFWHANTLYNVMIIR